MSLSSAGKQKTTEERDLLLRQIGARVLQHRQALGLTQKELADRLGIGPANIHRIEHGMQNLTVDTLCKLAEALGITAAELFTGTPPAAGGTDRAERSR